MDSLWLSIQSASLILLCCCPQLPLQQSLSGFLGPPCLTGFAACFPFCIRGCLYRFDCRVVSLFFYKWTVMPPPPDCPKTRHTRQDFIKSMSINCVYGACCSGRAWGRYVRRLDFMAEVHGFCSLVMAEIRGLNSWLELMAEVHVLSSWLKCMA